MAGAATRDDALVDVVDLAKYAPSPIEVAITPDGKTAVVTVGPGFFAGSLSGLVGAASIDLTLGDVVRIPWLAQAGPTHVAVGP
ncbi:MAG TPA: hypothetical protein VF395_19385 [Polyangiaceae bacterium]